MRIVQFMASSGYGGAEKSFIEVSNGMAERHDVTVILLRQSQYIKRFNERINIVELRNNPTSHNPLLHIELFSILRKLSPDIIHTHAAKAAMLVKRVNRFLGYHHLATKRNDRKGRIFNTLPFVSAVSQKAKMSVCSTVGGEVRVIMNGLVKETIGERKVGDVFTMVAVGRLDAIKGFDILIRQVAQLSFPFLLKIVGEGPEENRLRAMITELRLQSKVEMIGFREDVPQIMHDSDLVVISSHQEGAPKVLPEAVFYAPLLLSTPVGAVPDVLPDVLQTSLDTLGEDIDRIHKEYASCIEIFGKLKEEYSEMLSYSRMIGEYEQYYRDIIEG